LFIAILTQRGQATAKQVYGQKNFPTDRNNATDKEQSDRQNNLKTR
jgi:hypothetical protein